MEAYVGEIRMFAGSKAPVDWHWCDGSLLDVSTYKPLFDLIGTAYGGDGVKNFALPDLRGRVPVGMGQRSGSAAYVLGQDGGSETVALSVAEMPSHSHAVYASNAAGTTNIPGSNTVWANGGSARPYSTVTDSSPADAVMNAAALASSGGGQVHNNVMPSLAVNFIICLQGYFPAFS
ncbi:phage tail protein [Propionispora vibrioides]|uniref:Microcystin-dependent protein n=1 Tax=Propionispora vibrioides TaxID=112903 RepID=A0A1H8W0W5_9FIRM|nr:tail fiber protein [Propionispora vibrioides]SEP21245.1 Microcystin-dependent protein [Propionispora vibrioides]